MKRLSIIILVCLAAKIAWAQSIPISGQVFNQYGSPVQNAQVFICSAAASTGLPCTPVASIFYDYNLTMSAPNPYSTDANGNFNVYVGPLAFPNTYVVNIVANPGGTPYTQLYPGPSCPLSGCTFTGDVTAPIFNATSSPFYEVSGVQISSSVLSDAANLAKINAANVFTGTPQTAPTWNATVGFTVGGTALASTNLSDSANLARLNASNVFTGAIQTGPTWNATSGFTVGGTALAASNLSNGVSGTGAVCLASGSSCYTGGTVTSIGISSSTATQLTVSGSPVTGSGTIALGLNLTGTEAKVVTAATAGTSTHCAQWDASGGIGDAGATCGTVGYTTGNNVNGYWVKDPTGTITQRGEVTAYNASGTSTTTPITFPTTFPTALDSLVLSAGNSADNTGNYPIVVYSKSQSTAGATMVAACATAIGGSGCSAITNSVPVYWIAIGR